jgi:hypothetical protein
MSEAISDCTGGKVLEIKKKLTVKHKARKAN